jgi:hypothetical protein
MLLSVIDLQRPQGMQGSIGPNGTHGELIFLSFLFLFM